MRDTYDKSMKILYTIFILLLYISATSCEQFGVEVTTVKGEWKSDSYKNQYLILKISDNGMSHRTIHNDSTLVNRTGTWSLHNDTLSLYHQNFNADGVRIFKIEQMSMNTMTLRDVSNEDIWIMTRQYSTPDNDYDSHFNEVFDLKKGFWWYAWNIMLFVLCGVLGVLVLMGLYQLCSALIKWIHSAIKKK